MSMVSEMERSGVSIGRAVLLALAAGLSVAAVVGIAAILTRSFDQTDLRLVGTSLGFSVFSALGAAGARATDARRTSWGLGKSTMAGAMLGFMLLLVAIWVASSDIVWRMFGTVAVATLAASHACIVIRGRRATDSPTIERLVAVSVTTATVDSALGVVAISGAIKHVDSSYVRVLAVLVIVMLLTTALPPILRRLQVGAETVWPASALSATNTIVYPSEASELLVIADQLDGLARNPRRAAKQVGRQAADLRQIARRLQSEQRPRSVAPPP
jgi:hypothetical protein